MRTGTVSYKVDDLRKGIIIPIGFVGENDFTRVIFDAEEIYKNYPAAQVTMKVQPPKGVIYPAAVTRDGNTVIWQVKEADVANRGGGELQLTFIDGETKIKTYIAKTDVKRSLAGNGPAPDPVQDWVDNAEEVLDDLAAMDNIAKTAEAGDIGKALSPKTVENGVVTEWQFVEPGAGTDDYADLDNKPSIAGVTLSGNKTLEDLGIAADDDLDNLADEVSGVKSDIDGLDTLLGIGDPVMQYTMPEGYKSAAYSNVAGTNKYKYENNVLVLKKSNSYGEINTSNANLTIGSSIACVVDGTQSVYLTFEYNNENEENIAVIVLRYYNDNFVDYNFVNLPIPVGTGTAQIDLKKVASDNNINLTNRKNVIIRSIKTIETQGVTAKAAEADVIGFGIYVQPENRLDTIEDDIDDLEDDVSDIKDFDNAIRNPVNLYEALYEDLGYLDEETGGIRNFNATYIERLSAFIPVTAGETIHYQAWANGDPHGRIGYYNSSKVYVSYEDIPSANRTSTYAYLDKAVPSGISYIRFAYYGFGNGKACITRENIPTGWIPAYVDTGSKVFNNADTYYLRGINHRGYAEVAPENTMPAFIMSKEQGFDMVETDVQFTSDNVPVLLHDTTINRTARNADGTQIATETQINSITYAESQTYDFGIWKDASYAGTKIPKFEDFIILCKQIGLHPYIELKNDIVYTDEQLLALIAIVNKHDMMHLCTWKSFALSQLRVIKRNAPSARLGYLVSTVTNKRVSETIFLRTAQNEVFLDALVTNLTSELIALVKDGGVTLEAYGVNTQQAMLDLKDVLSGATSDEYNFPEVVKNSIMGS